MLTQNLLKIAVQWKFTCRPTYNGNVENIIHTFSRKCNEVKLNFAMLSCNTQSNLIPTYLIDLVFAQVSTAQCVWWGE